MEVKEKKKIGRNDPCSCGSGKKYKKCCLNQSTSIVDETRDSNNRMSQKFGKDEQEYVQKMIESTFDVVEKEYPRDQFEGTDEEYNSFVSDVFNKFSEEKELGFKLKISPLEDQKKMKNSHELVKDLYESWENTDQKRMICIRIEESKLLEEYYPSKLEYLLRNSPLEILVSIDDLEDKLVTMSDYCVLHNLRNMKEEMINNSILIER